MWLFRKCGAILRDIEVGILTMRRAGRLACFAFAEIGSREAKSVLGELGASKFRVAMLVCLA